MAARSRSRRRSGRSRSQGFARSQGRSKRARRSRSSFAQCHRSRARDLVEGPILLDSNRPPSGPRSSVRKNPCRRRGDRRGAQHSRGPRGGWQLAQEGGGFGTRDMATVSRPGHSVDHGACSRMTVLCPDSSRRDRLHHSLIASSKCCNCTHPFLPRVDCCVCAVLPHRGWDGALSHTVLG